MNVRRKSLQSKPGQKRMARRHILAFSIVLLISLLLIALIVWILLTQNLNQANPLIGLIGSIVTILVGIASVLIWIIENAKKPAGQNPVTHQKDLLHAPGNLLDPPAVAEKPVPAEPTTSTVQVQNSVPGPVVPVDGSQASKGNNIDAQASGILFQVGHPLSKDSPVYIERQADQDALRHLRNMEYIALIDARQQGKTSLIFHLMYKLTQQSYTFVMFDLSEQKYQNKSEEEWYKALGTSLLQNIDFIQQEQSLPTDSTSWEIFMRKIAEASYLAKQKTVVILDEVRDIPPSYATPFFTVIRMIFNQRPLYAHYNNLTFIIAGAFNPDELIRDRQVSKFIAQRIPLDDFDPGQVKQLVSHLRLSDELTDVVAQRINYWTDGQPYLTQRVCQLFSSQVIPQTQQEVINLVEKQCKQLYDDQHYLRRIRRLRETEPELFQYALSLAYGNRPYFSSGLLDQHFRLAHIYGVIKADSDNYCRIRNRICEHALTRIIPPPLQ